MFVATAANTPVANATVSSRPEVSPRGNSVAAPIVVAVTTAEPVAIAMPNGVRPASVLTAYSCFCAAATNRPPLAIETRKAGPGEGS